MLLCGWCCDVIDMFVPFQVCLYCYSEIVCGCFFLQYMLVKCIVKFIGFCLVVTWRTEHLSGWNDMSQSFSHFAADVRSSCNFCVSSLFCIVLYMMLSSANNLRVLCWMYSLKSFIYTRNRIGPKLFLGERLMLHEFYLIVHHQQWLFVCGMWESLLSISRCCNQCRNG